MSSSVGKRQRELQKRERAQAKAARKAARQVAPTEEADTRSPRTEAELISDLGALRRSFEAGEISLEEFESGRDRVQVQLERLLR